MQSIGELENLRAALAIAENKRSLEKRLRAARYCLVPELRERFKTARFDFANRRLIGDGFALVWKARPRPDQPESYTNQQTRAGNPFRLRGRERELAPRPGQQVNRSQQGANIMLAEAYARGVQIAEERFNGETRDFDRAIWGMAEAIKHGGHNVEPRDIADRWHNPLASAGPNYNGFAHWAKTFPMIHKGERPGYEPFEVRALFENRSSFWRTGSAFNASRNLHGDTIERAASALLDREIKRAFPKVRRNTKRFRELADSKREQARAIVRGEALDALRRAVADLRAWRNGDVERERVKISGHAEYLRLLALDLLALNPDCETGKALADRAEKINARLTGYIRGIDEDIAQYESIASGGASGSGEGDGDASNASGEAIASA